MKMTNKLILSFMSVALLVWIVGYIAVYRSQKAFKASIGKNSVCLAINILDEIEKDINSKIELCRMYSRDLLVQETVTESNRQFEKLDNIQSYIDKNDREWTSAPKETLTPFMLNINDSKLSEELREIVKFYEDNHGYRVFGEMFITNKYGANVGQTGKTTDYRQDDEEW